MRGERKSTNVQRFVVRSVIKHKKKGEKTKEIFNFVQTLIISVENSGQSAAWEREKDSKGGTFPFFTLIAFNY